MTALSPAQLDPFGTFRAYCPYLTITSKEHGVIPFVLNKGQQYLLSRIEDGYKKGKRKFVCLKARQVGGSTLGLAFDLFWPALYPHTLGSLITDTEGNRSEFRATLLQYYESLPTRFKFPIRVHNRNHIIYGNKSKLQYFVAGVRKNPNLGQGSALNYVHMTECSSYGDPESLDRLEAAFAETHPHRFFLMESTAKGYNHWYDIWQSAKQAQDQEAIFVAWWMIPEWYSLEDGSLFTTYRGLDLDTEERRMVEQVKMLYGYEITERQLAWWRWRLNEQYRGNLNLLRQERPSTEEECFQMTGSIFFGGEKLGVMRQGLISEPPPKFYRYAFGSTITDIKLSEQASQWEGNLWHAPPGAHLRVWREPVPGATYAIGGDPAYGNSEWSDRFACQVLRCWNDRVEQVAEFCTAAINPEQFAWVLIHLAAYYQSPVIIIEIDGPGIATEQEVRNIVRNRDKLSQWQTASNRKLGDVIGLIQPYLWTRPDSMTGSVMRQWKSSGDEKERMLTHLQTSFEMNRLVLHSPELLSEMQGVTRDGTVIEAKGRKKDDRVIALGLAHLAWKDRLQQRLITNQIAYRPAEDEWAFLQDEAKKANLPAPQPSQFNVAAFLPLAVQKHLQQG